MTIRRASLFVASVSLALVLLPNLEAVFSLGFLTKSSSLAYTVAGAFLGWFRDNHGSAALRAWYGGERLDSVTEGSNLATLEGRWLEELRSVQISEEILGTARLRFGRPGVFERRCPHVVDREHAQGYELLRAGANLYGDIGEVVTHANRALCQEVEELFVTMILARVEVSTRRLTYVNAGHPAGIVFDSKGNVKYEGTDSRNDK